MCSSSSLLLATLLGGCNAILGLHDVDESHRQFDAPVDGPHACPPIGQQPTFSRLVQTAFTQDCERYAIARSGRAVGICTFGGVLQLAIGAADQPLAPMTEIPTLPAPNTYFSVAISADGSRLLLKTSGGYVPSVVMYEETTTGWMRLPDPPFATAGLGDFSTMFATPTGDAVFVDAQTNQGEWHYDNGTWAQLPSTAGTISASRLSLTSDGLHAVNAFFGDRLAYSDRPDTSSPFRPFVEIEAPSFSSAFLGEDCARVYSTGLGVVAYVNEQ